MRPEGLIELDEFPDYGATPDGHIWSFKSRAWRRLKGSDGGQGYLKVNLYRDGVGHNAKPHVLVARAFLGPRPNGLEVNHKDGNKANNAEANLEYVTGAANVAHAIHVLGVGSTPPNEAELERRRLVRRSMRRRALAARLWLRDGRCALPRPARDAMKLSEGAVREIRAHAAARTMTRRAMAAHYVVSKHTIDRIGARTKWAHI